MKKFLIIMAICLISFGAKADLDATLRKYGLSSQRIDKKAIPFIDEDDYQTILDAKTNVVAYYADYSFSTSGGYNSKSNNLVLRIDDKAISQSSVHHEVQHLKDCQNLNVLSSELEPISRALQGAILEARAYPEGSIFLYKKRNELYEKMKMWEEVYNEVAKYEKLSLFSAGDKKEEQTRMELEVNYQTMKNVYEFYKNLYDRLNDRPSVDPNEKEIAQETKRIAQEVYDESKKSIKESMEIVKKEMEKIKKALDQAPVDINSVGIGFPTIKYIYESIKADYESFVRACENDMWVKEIEKAIKEGKNLEEIRHQIAIEKINSFDFIKNYLVDEYLNTKGTKTLSVKEIFAKLNDGKFTLEDFYQAENYWLLVCNDERAIGSEDCDDFWAQYEAKHCPNLRDKWKTCALLEKVKDVEENCEACQDVKCAPDKKIKWTNEEDEKAISICCAQKNFPLARKKK